MSKKSKQKNTSPQPKSPGNPEQRRWLIGLVVTVVLGVIATSFAAWNGYFSRSEAKQRDKRDQEQAIPKLEIVTNPGSNIPVGPGMYTVIHARNLGKSEALVTRLVFSNYKISKTPLREKQFGASPPRDVVLEERHRGSNGDFTVVLTPSVAIHGGEYQSFQVFVIIPKEYGGTYTGDITLHYDDGKSVTVSNIELDVLEKRPEP